MYRCARSPAAFCLRERAGKERSPGGAGDVVARGAEGAGHLAWAHGIFEPRRRMRQTKGGAPEPAAVSLVAQVASGGDEPSAGIDAELTIGEDGLADGETAGFIGDGRLARAGAEEEVDMDERAGDLGEVGFGIGGGGGEVGEVEIGGVAVLSGEDARGGLGAEDASRADGDGVEGVGGAGAGGEEGEGGDEGGNKDKAEVVHGGMIHGLNGGARSRSEEEIQHKREFRPSFPRKLPCTVSARSKNAQWMS